MMPVSARDYQRERYSAQRSTTAMEALVEDLNTSGTVNTSYNATSLKNIRGPLSSSYSAVKISATGAFGGKNALESSPPLNKSLFGRYRWKMRHYFYIHLIVFIFNGFLGGLIIWLIENYSSSRNTYMTVSYLDAWFMTISTICSCGLTTIDFASLSRVSQFVLMGFVLISGFAISTLPALIIKTRTHRNIESINLNDHNDEHNLEIDHELQMWNVQQDQHLAPHIRAQLALLPTPTELQHCAYNTCVILILGIYCTIYTIGFVAIGTWLQTHNSSEYLLQNNVTLNPWYVSCMLTLFSFNQNGLTPFSTNLMRFVDDVYLNIVIILLVISGSTFFPIILRNVVFLSRRLAPWRHKVIFDYILLNNHRLSTLLFPTLQTRIYFIVTIVLYMMGVGISLLLDLNSEAMAEYTPGIRFIIFLFQTVNLRFCGFQTFDISLFATATIVVYLLLMATKPQMLCALDECIFEKHWLALEAQAEVDAKTRHGQKYIRKPLQPLLQRAILATPTISDEASIFRHTQRFLRRQSHVTKELVKQEVSKYIDVNKNSQKKSKHLKALRIRLFLIHFIRALLKHTINVFVLTRTWLFIFIFLICAIEYRRMAPVDPDITFLKIIFEIVSAFGGVGMSLGYPNKLTSFAAVLEPGSKIILIATMLMGRHRGLLASMKDQEVIEYSAVNILIRRREEYIRQFQISNAEKTIEEGIEEESEEEIEDTRIVYF